MLSYVHPDLDASLALPFAAEGQVTISGLAHLTRRLSQRPIDWSTLVRHDPEARWYTRLLRTDAVELWLLGWWPGQGTAVHDHGGAMGSLTVLEGTLAEDLYDVDWQPEGRRHLQTGVTATFTTEHVHAVSAVGPGPATSLHAYSPPALPLRYTPSGDMIGTGGLA